jgi:hypothetical protein
MRWALFGSPDMLEYGAMKSMMGSQVAALLRDSLDPSRPFGSLGKTYKRLGRWLVNQHGAQWQGLADTQRQAREFISGPSLGTSECEALASCRHVYLRSFFLEPGDIKNLNLGAIWNYSKAAGLP